MTVTQRSEWVAVVKQENINLIVQVRGRINRFYTMAASALSKGWRIKHYVFTMLAQQEERRLAEIEAVL